MTFLKNTFLLLISLITLCSCKNDDDLHSQTFANYLESKPSLKGDVIACAGSKNIEESILVLFYPRKNTSNYKLFLANSTQVLKDDFKNYSLKSTSTKQFTGKTLRFFAVNKNQEEVWAIVSFEEEGQIKYSNPINLKHITSPTIYNFNIDISYKNNIPSFNWTDTPGKDGTKNVIFFQSIYNSKIQLVSGTYTLETNYEFLNNDNVILSITPSTDAQLIAPSRTNQIHVMGVSRDNWINFVSAKFFDYKIE